MKATVLNMAIAASLAAGANAQPHHHGHHHHKKNVDKRDVETTYVPATVTQYMLGSDEVSADEAKAGLDKGLYIVVGETTPTFTPPPKPVVTSSSSKEDAVFIQKVTSTSSSSSAYPTTTSSTTSSAAASSSSASSGYSTGATGVDAEFPSGKVKCTDFPEAYGAVPLNYLGLGGWTGLQFTPDYKIGDLSISYIINGVKGMAQQAGFYSYACPDGYVKTQWPEAQGSTKQSVGGLQCNSDGYLELSRPTSKTLCEPGVAGITIKNDMAKNVAICRTDYPGIEAMVIPVDSQPGTTRNLANVESAGYYHWTGLSTTLQYYVNQPGVSTEDGCVWDCASNHDECGNWAPTILGVGKAADGNTYISLFPNTPTSSAKPRMNINITGDVSIPCYFQDGAYAVGNSGCTTTIPSGGKAVIHFTSA
ncbi:SUN-domain-containing protein [Annulohypoxylon maeteangense]|uniref:SUN-domain-containing protein n=1 Tax=Annulohypoxylon maeteangense TaxID=1927788 RepID=UPI0020087F9C|nr:SUN-domain-containing protein [Annulohypoxylon maeteangense]KAI0890598.1 SUN-domain-containing protein [Annulohypoxylon maeteangense]